ncbi:MAG: CinA family protein [Candidatus Bacteroides intestinipullorum]|uniref:CinA family protein n=1 Tax=Candidatus Bacteroides intestinipullorum TaxID=2838471 RepID=A0A9E2KIZ7_9BACE|nr:CinA family protein [Candidatus Bacteroides intestinipullorum]
MRIEEKIGECLKDKGMTLSTAESCTGGGIAALITSVPGSSSYFKGGIVAYSNEVKMNLLHVSPQTLEKYGAVSRETVIEMAKGAMEALKTECAVATSGIAGPGGGTLEKPVGTIWMAVACRDKIVTRKEKGDLGRIENVKRTIQDVLAMLCSELEQIQTQ